MAKQTRKEQTQRDQTEQPDIRKERPRVDDIEKFEEQLTQANWDEATDPLVNDGEGLVEVSLDELYDMMDEDALGTTRGDLIRTSDGDGSTDDIQIALDQGLVYDPPTDPPVVPSDDYQNVEIAAGFSSSMEEDGPDVFNLPARVDNNDADLEDDVRRALHYNSETTTLDDLEVRVREGVVTISGSVPMEMDMAMIDAVLRDLDDVVDVHYKLRYTEE